jgi:hypothetical protein
MAGRPIPEPEPPEADPDLEKTIADLIDRKYAAPKGSAEYRLVMRELAGLRYTREMAGRIMEDIDPFGWGAMLPNPAVDPGTPTGKVLPMQRRPRCKQARLQFFIFLRCSSSHNFQMKATRLLALDAPKCAVCVLLLCQAILDYMNRELATPIHKHSDTFNRLTPRPRAEFAQAVARQILPSDPGRELQISHGQPIPTYEMADRRANSIL